MTLNDLLRRAEGKTLEFKRNLKSPQGALKTLVAFANTAGGTLLIGVEDRTKAVCGVENPLRLEETVGSLIADSISPRLIPDIEILPWRDSQVLAVIIHASPNRPHHLSREGPEQGVYARVGSSNRRADAALISEMRRYAQGVIAGSYDEQPMPELYSESIDFRAASEYFAPVRKLRKRDLATLRLLARHQGRDRPTVGGVLLFGPERLSHFPAPGTRNANTTKRSHTATAANSRVVVYPEYFAATSSSSWAVGSVARLSAVAPAGVLA